jgi:hypothetical protein
MSHKPKVLFVGINIRYMNPTSSLWISVLARIFHLHFYGPGFVDSKTLASGIEKYIQTIGDIDFIFANHYLCFEYTSDRINRFVNNFTATLNGKINISQEFLKETKLFLKNNRQRVCCFLTEVDPHVTSQSNLDECLRHASYFILWGSGFLNANRNISDISQEKYIQTKLKIGSELGCLDKFVITNRANIINLGHLVGNHEFYWGTLSNRKFEIIIPGSKYYKRKKLTDVIDNSSFGLKLFKPRYSIAYKIAQKLFLKPYSNFYLVNLYNLTFQRVLSQCKICITEGGANNYPVRKIFEIPAAGALLVCIPTEGFELLGFQHEVNCVFLENIEDVVKVIDRIYQDLDHYARIAKAGQDLVLMKHSISARAEQLSEAFKRIQEGSFNGSTWHDGNFICHLNS